MADLPPENPDEFAAREQTPVLMNRYIAGEVESLQTLMDRHDQRLHRMANRFRARKGTFLNNEANCTIWRRVSTPNSPPCVQI